MKGLLIKDFKLMRAQRLFYLLICAVMIGMTILYEEPLFPVGFLTFVGALFSLSSISYDEFDNGNAFLFSLPITRKGYVLEKYGFGLILGAGSLALALGIVFLTGMAREGMDVDGAMEHAMDTIRMGIVLLPCIVLLLSVLLPIQLKFGGEKGQIAIIGVVGALTVAGVLTAKGAEALGIDLTAVAARLFSAGMGMVLAAGMLLSLAAMLLSLAVSMAVVEKKEF